jgi:hypothetical protein
LFIAAQHSAETKEKKMSPILNLVIDSLHLCESTKLKTMRAIEAHILTVARRNCYSEKAAQKALATFQAKVKQHNKGARRRWHPVRLAIFALLA